MPYQPLFPEPAPRYRPIFEPEEEPSFWKRFQDYGSAARTSFGKSLKSSLWDVTRIPETLAELQLAGKKALLPKSLEPFATTGDEAALSVLNALTPGFVRERRDRAAGEAKEAQVAKAEAGLEAGIPDWLQVAQNFGEDFTTMALDPLELLPGGAVASGVRKATRGTKATPPPSIATALARGDAEEAIRIASSHAGQGGESPEAIARVARGERYYRVTPGGEVLPIPNTVDAVDMRVNPGEAKVRVTAQGTVEIEQGGRGGRAQSEAIARLRGGEAPEAPSSRIVEGDPGVYELDLGEGLPGEEVPGKFRPPEDPFQYSANILEPSGENLGDIRRIMDTPEVARQRREGLSLKALAENPEMAQRLSGKTVNDFLSIKPGTPMNEEDFAALQGIIVGKGRELDTARAAVATGLGGEESAAAFARAQQDYIRLVQVDMGGRTTTARTLKSFQLLKKAIQDPQDLRIHLQRQFGPKLDEDSLKLLTEMDLENPDEVAEFFRKAARPEWQDYPKAIFYNSILSGLGTFGRNLAGTVSHMGSYIPVRGLASVIDRPLAKLRGRPRAYYAREILPAIASSKQGFLDGARVGLEILKRGATSQKFEIPRNPFMLLENPTLRKTLGTATDVSSRVLEATDAVNVTAMFQAERKARALRRALQEGHEDAALDAATARYMDDPDVVGAAMDEAKKAAFRDDPGSISKGVQELVNKIPGGWMLVPFVRIGGRLMQRGFEWTPVYGGVKGVAKAIKGDPEAAELLAKATLGSSIMAYTWSKAAAGEAVGSFAGMSPAERQQAYDEGKKPYSMRFGDHWLPMAQLEPLAAPFALTMSAFEVMEDDEANASEKLYGALLGVVENRLSASFLSGLSDLLQGIYYREAGAPARFVSRTATAFANPASGASRSLANALDPRIVETEGFADEWKSTIPGLKQSLPAKLDRWGEPITRTIAEALGPTGTPLVPSPVSKDPVVLELGRLGVNMGFPGKTAYGVKLTEEEHRSLVQSVGPQTYKALQALVTGPEWGTIPDAEKVLIIDWMVEELRGVGRDLMLPKVVDRWQPEETR